MLSIWEKETWFAHADYLIIGGGITGMNAGISLKLKCPSAKVLVIDKGAIGDGASFRNAGFACLGSPTELLSDIHQHGADFIFSIVEMRWRGLNRLIELLGASALDLSWCGGIEIFPDTAQSTFQTVADALPELNSRFSEVLGISDHYKVMDHSVPNFKNLSGAVHIEREGRLHSGKMMQSLHRLGADLGVTFIGGLDVFSISSEKNRIEVRTRDGKCLTTRRLGVATNGFSRTLFPDIPVVPARNQVYVTSPLKNPPIDKCIHCHEGFIYARRVGDRLLIGGGRHLDLIGEQTDQQALTSNIQQFLEQFVSRHFQMEDANGFEYGWSGTLGIGDAKMPYIAWLDNHIAAAVRLGGMGVAIGTLVGESLASMLLSE